MLCRYKITIVLDGNIRVFVHAYESVHDTWDAIIFIYLLTQTQAWCTVVDNHETLIASSDS